MKKQYLFLLFLSVCAVSCKNTPILGISEVIDQAVSRVYETGNMDEYTRMNQSEVLETFAETEKSTLASQYLIFDINQKAEIILFRDIKQKEAPFWLEEAGFQKTEDTAENEFDTFEIWTKTFPKGRVSLGIPGFDNHGKVYFVAIKSLNNPKHLKVKPVYPKNQIISPLEVGAYTYFDWDELVLTQVPDIYKGATLLATNRGRSRESHLINAFRYTPFPTSDTVDQILQTWVSDAKSSIHISWRAPLNTEHSQIYYWEKETRDTLKLPANSVKLEDRLLANDRFNRRFYAEIKDLKPGTVYQYQIQIPHHISETYTFQTDSEDDHFEFGWFGDVHNDKNWGRVLQKGDQKFKDIRFYLQSGDLVNTGLYRDDWDKLIAYSGEVFRNKPIMAVSGNHDTQAGLPPTRFLEYLKYPHNGPQGKTPGLSYTFTYGNTDFFMLDVVGSSEESQAKWLEEVLLKSHATFKIAAFHFSPFTPHEEYEDIIQFWVPLFERYKVDLVLTGHFHYYQRTKAHGTDLNEPGIPTYIMSVGTTNKNEGKTSIRENEIVIFKPHIFTHIQINGKRLRFTAYDEDENIIDQFLIKKD